MPAYDFVIVGAGMAGASVAFELARAARVCVIEAEDLPGYHSTGRSAALFAPAYGGKTIRALTRASKAFFDSPPAQFASYPLLHARGCLFIARADQHERLGTMLETLRSTGGRVSTVGRESVLEKVALLRHGYVESAILDEDAMDIDVDALHQGYLRGARAAGVRLITGAPVTRIRRVHGRWRIDLTEQALEASVIINAAGAWADEIAGASGARPLGLQSFRRTVALVDVPDHVRINEWPAVIDVDEQFYFKPEAGRLLLSPADETPMAAGDVQPDDLDVAVGIDRIEAALEIDVRRVVRTWSGLRTFTRDRTPVVGFDPSTDGFFWCSGQGGYGIQAAPGLARSAAALAKGEPLPKDIVAEGVDAGELSPARFNL